jgi:SAM-dependent methyltransferase
VSRGPSRYVHGTDPEEQRRLSRLNDLLNEAALREIALRGGESILDLGCGLAQLTRAMARAAGVAARVVGIERSAEQIAEAVRQSRAAGEERLVDLRVGDAAAPPLREEEWGTFDVTHARFLLEHLPDPLAAVQVMVRAVRPGGRIVLQDDDHDLLRMWPEPPGLMALWRAYIRSYDRNGTDPFVGRRLVSLLHLAGATPVRNTWLFFGACPGQPVFRDLVANLAGILRGARAAILEAGRLEPGAFDAALASLDGWAARPDAALWFAVSWAEGIRPPVRSPGSARA